MCHRAPLKRLCVAEHSSKILPISLKSSTLNGFPRSPRTGNWVSENEPSRSLVKSVMMLERRSGAPTRETACPHTRLKFETHVTFWWYDGVADDGLRLVGRLIHLHPRACALSLPSSGAVRVMITW